MSRLLPAGEATPKLGQAHDLPVDPNDDDLG